MKYRILLAAGAGLALAACGQQQKSETQANAPAVKASQTYSGAGAITAIAGDQVSIEHGPIAGIGWPAMTMTFTAPADVAQGARVGEQVDFSFRKNGSAYQLTSLRKH
jgi:Cu(I)/Ag(I) efflux system periplasmic protein CusF